MKKILLASSALVASASFAAADVSVSGSGYMGVVYNDSAADDFATTDTLFKSRIRIQFDASGETDGGLTFGGSIRADNAADGNIGKGGSVYLAGSVWKLTMGDIDGGAENAIGDLAGVGYEGNGDDNEAEYLTGGKDEGLLAEFALGAATIYASAGQFNAGDNEFAVGVSFDAGVATVGIGYEDDGAGNDHTLVSASADVSGATLKAYYGDHSNGTDQYGVSVSAPLGGATVTAYYRDALTDGVDGYGLGVAYDLGGGAAFKVGVADFGDVTKGSAGVTFSF